MNASVVNIPGLNPNPVGLGDKLRNRRLELHLFQKDVAKIFNVSEESIVNWENHHRELQIQFYHKLIEFLGYFPFEIDTTTVAGKIKKYRYVNGFIYKEVGKLLGVNASTIRSWELKKNVPCKSTLEKLEKLITDG